MYYPELDDDDFYENIYKKKEFHDTKTDPDTVASLKMEQVCNPEQFVLQKHQEFLQNYLSPETPYNSLLAFHGVGTGKCVHGDTPIKINGNEMLIRDVWDRYHQKIVIDQEGGEWSTSEVNLNVSSLHLPTNSFVARRVSRLYREKVHTTLKNITLVDGNRIVITQIHHLLTINGWTNNIRKNDLIAVCNDNRLEYSAVASIKEQTLDGYVYDLEIPELHNYVASNIVAHNTCAGVSVAEGFKEYVQRYGKKIIVLASDAIQKGWKSNLYNPDLEIKERNLSPGSLQCTGNTYYIDPSDMQQKPGKNDGDTLTERRYEKIAKKYRRFYDFYGYEAFANYVDVTLREELNAKPGDYSKIVEYFSNTLFIIDEAHNLTKNAEEQQKKKKKTSAKEIGSPSKTKKTRKTSEHSILWILNTIFGSAKNTKLLMLTATPIRDSKKELVDILNLLIRNHVKDPNVEKSMVDQEILFPNQGEVNTAYLRKIARGFVSYLRGESPITFPTVFDPPPNDVNDSSPNASPINAAYVPSPRVSISDSLLDDQYDNNITQQHLQLVGCRMHPYQYSNYLNVLNSAKREVAYITVRQAADIVFPPQNPDNDGVIGNTGFQQTFSRTSISQMGGGNTRKSARSTDPIDWTQIGGERKTKELTYYSYQHERNEGFLSEERVYQYSAKYHNILKYLKRLAFQDGIAFIHSTFKEIGGITIALMLEEFGFRRFGYPKPFLRYRNNNKKHNERCSICMELSNDEIHTKRNHQNYHKFNQARYILFTGDDREAGQLIHTKLNTLDNRNGRIIRVIIGTDVASEGVDMKRVRSVHLVDPWFNTTKMHQIIGRGARHCSHIDLSPEQRNVEVFRYSVRPTEHHSFNADTLPDNFDTKKEHVVTDDNKVQYTFTAGELVKETVDENIYNTALHKDIETKAVERVLKEIAIDCNLNKAMNVFPNEQDGSRGCDYQECDYQCSGNDDGTEWGYTPDGPIKVNKDTYNIRFSKTRINKAMKFILAMYQRHYALKLEDIVKKMQQIDPESDIKFIHEALRRILGGKQQPPMMTRDRYGRIGHVIYRNGFYIYQPKDLNDQDIPMYYRKRPLDRKVPSVSIASAVMQRATNMADVKYVDQDYINSVLKDFSDAISEGRSIDDSLSYMGEFGIDDRVVVLARIDRLSIESQKYLLEETVTGDYHPQLKKLILDYYHQQGVLFRLDTHVEMMHIMGTDKFRLYDGQQWTDAILFNPTVQKLKKGKLKMGVKGTLSGYSWYSGRNYRISLIDKSDEVEISRNLNKQELQATAKEGKSFKELDINVRNQKFIKHGMVCSSYRKDNLIKFVKALWNDDTVTRTIEEADFTNLSLCSLVEMKLRQLDMVHHKTQRYFTNYLENILSSRTDID